MQVYRSDAKIKTNRAGKRVVYWHEDYDGVFVESMELENFPFDCQPLRIILTLKSAKDACQVGPHENELQPVLHRRWFGHSEWDTLEPALYVDYVSKTHSITGKTQTRTRITSPWLFGVRRRTSSSTSCSWARCARIVYGLLHAARRPQRACDLCCDAALDAGGSEASRVRAAATDRHVTLLDRRLAMIAFMLCQMIVFAGLCVSKIPWPAHGGTPPPTASPASSSWVARLLVGDSGCVEENRHNYPPVILNAGASFPADARTRTRIIRRLACGWRELGFGSVRIRPCVERDLREMARNACRENCRHLSTCILTHTEVYTVLVRDVVDPFRSTLVFFLPRLIPYRKRKMNREVWLGDAEPDGVALGILTS